MTARGRFISLEGIDGAGKSTHAAWLKDALVARGRTVVATREPGGTPLGESLRSLLLGHPMSHDTEALLMFAARREHVARVIEPALVRGDWVLCDRFTDATFAYQGGGHGVPRERICELESFIPAHSRPELTILFDVPVELGRERAGAREADRFEREQGEFFQRVRQGYLRRARENETRFRVIDASAPPLEIQKELEEHILSIWPD